LKLYRLWCGKKRHSPWLTNEGDAWRRAVRLGFAFEDAGGQVGLGPLTWIEIGERQYARSRTVVVGRNGR